MQGSALTLISLLWLGVAIADESLPQTRLKFGDVKAQTLTFQLTGEYVTAIRPEADNEIELLYDPSSDSSTSTLKAIPTAVYRPESYEAIDRARYSSRAEAKSIPIQWHETWVLGPDVTDRHTLGQLARMSSNAYHLPGQKQWRDLDPSWNINNSFPFGWDNAEDGFRGFVFQSEDNSTVVLSIKGTTLQGPTSRKDKLNDNLLFSCCCARVDFSWIFSTVCDCYSWSPLHNRCDDPCLSAALIKDSLFYSIGTKLVRDLRVLYPFANIWLVGHSLGGSLASLLGSTFGLPAVAFEAPGERMAAHRLHLPLPPPNYPPKLPRVPVTHVYNNADPIPQGACTGIASPCAQVGYALETRCHLGKTIVYDTVGRFGWHVDVRKHRIDGLILDVLDAEGLWPDGEAGEEREVPTAREEAECVDCFKWEFGHFKKCPIG
ncbi:Lipase [Pisolithus croceorrhizus]|nr:Lipase [Pisolithus croceorrhizus]